MQKMQGHFSALYHLKRLLLALQYTPSLALERYRHSPTRKLTAALDRHTLIPLFLDGFSIKRVTLDKESKVP